MRKKEEGETLLCWLAYRSTFRITYVDAVVAADWREREREIKEWTQ